MSDQPRCATCRFWDTSVLLGGDGESFGSCGITVADTGIRCEKRKRRKAIAHPLDTGSFLETHAEFGCVQHEAKKP